ncbi:MAG: hypothetical protein II918_08535 [Firmicutes bacterium]|nr:hypothetical protein [Bacillota bacterium]
MILTKYDEIMKEINLTPEAKERIIENICQEMEGETKVIPVRKRNFRRYLTTAACCVLVIAGAIAASRTGFINDILGGDSAAPDMDEQQIESSYESEPMEGAASETGDGSAEEGAAEITPDSQVVESEPSQAVGNAGSDNEGSVNEGTDQKSSEEKGTDREGSQGDGSSEEEPSDNAQEGSKGLVIAGNSQKGLAPENYSGGAYGSKEEYFDSLDELNDYLGYDMDPGLFEKACLDKGLTDIEYIAYSKSIGEIRYTDGKTVNYYRMGSEEDSLVWDKYDHDLLMEFDGIETSGSLSGHRSKYELAEWSSVKGYNYAAFYKGGLSESKWTEIINGKSEEGDER